MRYALIKLIFLIIPLASLSQENYHSQQNKVLIYDICSGALIGGVGAILNKHKGQNWKRAAVRGLWQGCVGGTLNFCGKKTLFLVNRDQSLGFAWPAKLIHDAGTSIVENASAGNPFLQNWHTNIGPIRLDFTLISTRKLRVRFLPICIYSIAEGFSYGRLNFLSTLGTGNMAFVRKGLIVDSSNGGNYGVGFGRSFVYTDNKELKFHVIAHEVIHEFQFDEHQSLNSWLIPLAKKINWKTGKEIFTKYVYLDVPHFWLLYKIEGYHPFPYQYRNFFEMEAESLSTNKYVRTR